jgi:hypothetical protein
MPCNTPPQYKPIAGFVTRNTDDFSGSKLPVFTPEKFLEQFKQAR